MLRKNSRIHFLRIFFISVLLIVLWRILYIQIHDRFISSLIQNEWRATSVIQPKRGTIFDSLGNPLAFSMPAYDMDIDLALIQQLPPQKLRAFSDRLAVITGASKSVIWSQLNRKNTTWLRLYPYLVHVSYQTKNAILKLFSQYQLTTAVNPYRTYERVYPSGTLAAHVIGFLDQSGNGAAGIELEYNSYLKGQPGFQSYTQENGGTPIPLHPVVSKPVKNGDNVYLSINPAIESYADQALSTIETRFHPSHAAIIVSNPNTGAILAMAALPFFNPNDYWNYSPSTLNTNWAISDPFEPGSTFKIVTLTGALATHAINLNQTYMSGVDYVNGVPIRDWNLWGWGRISYRKAMIYSSNVGFIHIAQAEGVPTLYRYIHLYGLDKPTGIDLPGESSSILFPEKNLNPVDFATMAFGQGLAITPIQQIAEVGAVANGGKLLKPYLIQKIVAPNGKVVYRQHPEVVRRVAPKSIMEQVTRVMVQDVADNQYEVNAYIPGYNIAGKTGTAQIPNPNGGGYLQHQYNLSFIAFAPAYHPKLAIYVTVNEPHNTIQYGNSVASPAAQFVLKRSFSYLHLKPHTKAGTHPGEYLPDPYAWNEYYQNPTILSATNQQTYITMPDLSGVSVLHAKALLTQDGLRVQTWPLGGYVIWQWPKPGHYVIPSQPVSILTTYNQMENGDVVVPNFNGMSMKVAIDEARVLGLQVKISGSGYAVKQNLAPLDKVPMGSVVHVVFAP